MELNLYSLFGLHVHSCVHWMRPRNPPPPRIYEGAVGQPRYTTSLCNPLGRILLKFRGLNPVLHMVQYKYIAVRKDDEAKLFNF
jgi:hypothetical protein